MPEGVIFSIEDAAQKQIVKTFCSHAKNNRVSELVNMLKEYNSFNIDTPFSNGFTALHYACKYKALNSASFLLKIGANLRIAAKDHRGTTPLDLCADDPDFKKKVVEIYNADPIVKGLTIAHERKSRFQPGDLYYEIGFTDAHTLNDKIYDLLYSITGDKFDVCVRKREDKYVYDAIFDSRDSGLVSLDLTRAGIPHEYVNLKYLIVTDLKSEENIAKLREFHFNPLNKYYIYCEDELKKNRLKDNERGNNIKTLDPPKFIRDKYFTVAPQPSTYFWEPKNDPESQLYFARTHHKCDPVPGCNIKYEQLSAKARESLATSFTSCLRKPFPIT